MRKSQARFGVRPGRAVLATAATAAAVVAGTATAAFATVATTDQALTVTPTQINSYGGSSITLSQANVASTSIGTFTQTTFSSWFTTASSCPATSPTASATAVAGPTGLTVSTASSTDTVTIANTPPLTTGAWRVCLYDGASPTVLAGHSSTTVAAVPFGTLSSATGTSTVANTVTVNAAGAFTASSFSSELNSSSCPATYVTPSGTTVIAAQTQKTSTDAISVTVPASASAATGYYVCTYAGSSAGTSALVARSTNTYGTYASTLPAATVSPTGGSSGATNANITLSTTAGTIPTTGTMTAFYTRASCPSTYTSPSGDQVAGTVTRISTSKVAITVGSSVVAGVRDATTPWNVCLYSPQGALLVAPSVYTVAPALDLSGIFNTNGNNLSISTSGQTPSIYPTGGPAQGGTKVTISNLSGIPTATGALLTVSLGGSPLSGVTALDSNTVTGTTSAHAPGPVNLSITTAAGTKTTTFTLADATTHAGVFNYAYAINVTPNTAPPLTAGAATGLPTLDITGAGFSALNFANIGGTTADAHVLLTSNGWYNQAAGGNNLTTGTGLANPFAPTNSTNTGGTNTGTVAPQTQCINVLPITDNELICSLDLGNTLTGNASYSSVAITSPAAAVLPGTYSITVINNGGATPLLKSSYNYSVISSGSAFTVAAF